MKASYVQAYLLCCSVTLLLEGVLYRDIAVSQVYSSEACVYMVPVLRLAEPEFLLYAVHLGLCFSTT